MAKFPVIAPNRKLAIGGQYAAIYCPVLDLDIRKYCSGRCFTTQGSPLVLRNLEIGKSGRSGLSLIKNGEAPILRRADAGEKISPEASRANGQTHDFLLTPDGVPILASEPTTLVLFGLVATVISLRAVRRRA